MKRAGYLSHSIVKGFVFWLLTACITTATLAKILEYWEIIGEKVAGRCIWTAFVLACAGLAFLLTNYLFGDLSGLIARRDDPPAMDPAFGERLRQAKLDDQSKVG